MKKSCRNVRSRASYFPLTLCPYDLRAWFGLLDTSISKVLFILKYCIVLDGSYYIFSDLALLAPNLRNIPNSQVIRHHRSQLLFVSLPGVGDVKIRLKYQRG